MSERADDDVRGGQQQQQRRAARQLKQRGEASTAMATVAERRSLPSPEIMLGQPWSSWVDAVKLHGSDGELIGRRRPLRFSEQAASDRERLPDCVQFWNIKKRENKPASVTIYVTRSKSLPQVQNWRKVWKSAGKIAKPWDSAETVSSVAFSGQRCVFVLGLCAHFSRTGSPWNKCSWLLTEY